jgi:hypothetical protein
MGTLLTETPLISTHRTNRLIFPVAMGEDRGHPESYRTPIILFLLNMGTVSALPWLQLVMMTPLSILVTALKESMLLTVPAEYGLELTAKAEHHFPQGCRESEDLYHAFTIFYRERFKTWQELNG